jgi:uncharacterized repeat protein (TIGR03803 family)
MRNAGHRAAIILLATGALGALTPAVGASRIDQERFLAIHGSRPPVLRRNGAAAPVQADSVYTVLHDFAGGPGDGANSSAGLTMDNLGNIYGTTEFGGANGDGTIFKLAQDGTLTVLHSFSGADGSTPDGALTLTGNGGLYGTTQSGGVSGNGVLFTLTSQGRFKVLHDFQDDECSFARGRLARDELGNLHGTNLFGGPTDTGCVFTLLHDTIGHWGPLVTYDFSGYDGAYPEHGVVRDTAGNLYGVTVSGGDNDDGTIFKIATDGTLTTLHSFNGNDGEFPYGGLAIDKAGNLFGSAGDGGAHGFGIVFEYSADGTLTTLYNFKGGADGAYPQGDMLIFGKKLFSTASGGGNPACQCGVIYEIPRMGKEIVLHAFNGDDGNGYSAGLTAHNGLLYGTTEYGGAHELGVVFSVTPK